MIKSQVISHAQIPRETDNHLISFGESTFLAGSEIRTELLNTMKKEATFSVADCVYDCLPFGRITLLSKEYWTDSVTSKLQTALRPLLKNTRCSTLTVDCSLWNPDVQSHRAQVTSLLIFLFNLDYQLSDLGFKKITSTTTRIKRLNLWCPPEHQAALEKMRLKAEAISTGMMAARRLADLPSEQCTPDYVVTEIEKQIARYQTLSCEVLDESQIKLQGLGLLDIVGKGASHPPRLMTLRYEGHKQGPFSIYVGKGITFDSGGLWLKGGEGMYTMKYDMCGAANVFGLFIAAATLRLPVRIIGILALAENMIGPDAMRPGDVAISHAGLSVEINNTDAEGRLVLADAIAYATKLAWDGQQPQYIIDMATLTGAVVKALGYDLTGLWSQHAQLSQKLIQAGRDIHDEVWPLPLDRRFAPQIDSMIADLCNTPPNNAAISSSAAFFLSRFCPDVIPWAHLDISGTALWREQGHSVASGRPIPLLIQHLLNEMEIEDEKNFVGM